MISCYHENHIPSFSIALAFPIRPEVKKTTATLSEAKLSSGPSSDPPRQSSSHTSACPRRSLLWKDGPVRSCRSRPCDFQPVKQARRKVDDMLQ